MEKWPSAEQVRTAAIRQGLALKRANAAAAVLCGGVPAALLAFYFPSDPGRWVIGFFAGLLWANAFEYVYHRYLLHWPGTSFARRHMLHHASVGTASEAAEVNLGSSPLAVVQLFAVNGTPVVIASVLLHLGVASGMLAAFSVYLVVTEEIHWRIHMGGRLPPGIVWARAFHLAHHDRPDGRFNIFLPLFDWLFGSMSR